ncbi:unnamed protein product [Penicillium salamii]|uniref:Serine aminopeptidase S33 domain-containing protein n=1 Tax=Penicillium salamii TaxID=1612424 RepID=A0A9W4NFV1_9EURO|nr:unnamed protein product [Penicillium salamii]CAG8070933.1 unnamed protein product [Penicillium salamii]CAG8097490.1 unnamed protein product [Penicillium salamii]CAG8131689.1 unnamed protein product [Penicillium salamii]CAG8278230.1 unnamed protein product [Penicillium salamii]
MTEGSLTLPDGLELYTKTWSVCALIFPTYVPWLIQYQPNGTPRATIAFIHGFSDHCNAYHDLFPNLASAGIEIKSFDQRGWGRSVKEPRDRGNTGPTSQVLAEIHIFLQSLPPSDIPLFLMGHSMGGGQVLNYIFHPDSPYQSSPPKFAGVLLYSPLIAIHPSSRPSKVTVAAGRVVARLIPHKQRYSALDAKLISRDPAIVEYFRNDDLCHDTGTFAGLAGMLDRGIWLEGMFTGDWAKSELPFWFGHGNGDHITSYDATKEFVRGLQKNGGDVTFETYEGAYHKLSADLPETSTKFTEHVRDWVLGQVSQTETSGSQNETAVKSNVPRDGSGPEAKETKL